MKEKIDVVALEAKTLIGSMKARDQETRAQDPTEAARKAAVAKKKSKAKKGAGTDKCASASVFDLDMVPKFGSSKALPGASFQAQV